MLFKRLTSCSNRSGVVTRFVPSAVHVSTPALVFFNTARVSLADFLNRGFQGALKLLVADDGGVFFRQRPALAARDFKERIARHAEFLFDDRR